MAATAETEAHGQGRGGAPGNPRVERLDGLEASRTAVAPGNIIR